ncbi:hypothetical protein [Nocardioides daejeonensis]|uniref:hypothetical protein n=1 Tax=Nocardioides daejeonensis TaxID=1046556 RepID=UPI000D75044C|nr:hypothetical protein [Nocardioides daejeonensis]
MSPTTALVPLFAFMLLPLMIPVAAVAIGAVTDRLTPGRKSAATLAVDAAKERTSALRDVGVVTDIPAARHRAEDGIAA